MKKLGFIGTGSMGSLIIEAFIQSGYTPPENVHITNRTLDKAKKLQQRFPQLTVHEHTTSIVNNADWIFLCTKPKEMVPVLESISESLKPNHVIVTITSPLQVEETEHILSNTNTPTVRFVPSIVNLSLEGPSLVTFGDRCSDDLREELWEFFSSISTPITIGPEITRVASDIASCGPAFISYLVERMIQGATEETKIDKETATKIAEAMLVGYGELLRQNHFNLPTLRKRVTVPGGVTGVGLNVLQKETGNMFNQLFQETEKKYQEDRRGISDQIQNKGN